MNAKDKINALLEQNSSLAQLLQIEACANVYNRGIPFYYNPKNKIWNTNTHINYMLARTNRFCKYDGLPDSIPRRNLEYMLQTNGHVFITEWKGELYAFTGGLFGQEDSPYLNPTKYMVVNVALGINETFNLEDGVLILNDSSYMGLLPLLSKYGSQLSENELTMHVVDVLSRAALVFNTKDEVENASAKQYIKSLYDGDLDVVQFQGSKIPGMETEPVCVQPGATTSASILTNLIEYEQYLKASEFNELGLNANWNAKRESLSGSESLLNEDVLKPLIDDMLECRKEGIEQVNKKFGLNITVSFDSAWEDNEIEMEKAQEEITEEDGEVNDEPGDNVENEPSEKEAEGDKDEKDNE